MRRQHERSIAALSDDELLHMRIAVEAEMRRRNMEFSVGLMGEKLVIDYFKKTAGLPKLLAAPRGTKNVDAISRQGDRYTIKTLLKAQKTGAIYDERREPTQQLFEYLLLVRLDGQYRLRSVHRFSWPQFLKVRKWDKRMTAWYLNSYGATLRHGEVILAAEPGTAQ